jgi:hypothetical protein
MTSTLPPLSLLLSPPVLLPFPFRYPLLLTTTVRKSRTCTRLLRRLGRSSRLLGWRSRQRDRSFVIFLSSFLPTCPCADFQPRQRQIVGYGHVGDGALVLPFVILVSRFPDFDCHPLLTGNLHLNVISKDWSPSVGEILEPWIYEAVGTSPFPDSHLFFSLIFSPPPHSQASRFHLR